MVCPCSQRSTWTGPPVWGSSNKEQPVRGTEESRGHLLYTHANTHMGLLFFFFLPQWGMHLQSHMADAKDNQELTCTIKSQLTRLCYYTCAALLQTHFFGQLPSSSWRVGLVWKRAKRKHTRGSSYWEDLVDIRLVNNYTKYTLMRDKYFSFFLIAKLCSAYVSDGYVRAVFYLKF